MITYFIVTTSIELNKKTSTRTIRAGTAGKKDLLICMVIIGFIFFIFGFVSWVNSILIPYFKIACELTNVQAYLVTFSFYIAYFVMSLPAAWLLKKRGFKNGMQYGFWLMAFGAFLFIPAAYNRTYPVFLMGLFTIGTGLAILQTAVNPYVTILGPLDRAAQRISVMGIFNKGAGICAPLIFAAVVLRPSDTQLFHDLGQMSAIDKEAALSELLRRVMVPYAWVGSVLFLLGILIKYSPLPDITTDNSDSDSLSVGAGKKTIFAFPQLILGAVGIFLHVGTQVIAIDTVIGYANSMHISILEAKAFPAYTLAATIGGYLVGIICIPRFVSQLLALRVFILSGLLFALLIQVVSGEVYFLNHRADLSIWFVVLLGFSNSLVWAGIWPLALDGLGRFTKVGASIMVMGLCGNAILPLIYGWLADLYSTRHAYWVLIPCYFYLVFYSFVGYRLRSWKLSRSISPIPGTLS